MENPIKMDDLGVPLFLETPKCIQKTWWVWSCLVLPACFNSLSLSFYFSSLPVSLLFEMFCLLLFTRCFSSLLPPGRPDNLAICSITNGSSWPRMASRFHWKERNHKLMQSSKQMITKGLEAKQQRRSYLFRGINFQFWSSFFNCQHPKGKEK